MSVNEVLDRDAVAQAEAITRGEVSPTELVQPQRSHGSSSATRSCNAVDPSLCRRGARDRRRPRSADGPFRGVPFLLKDGVAHSAGHPFHCGMQALKDAGQHRAAPTRVRAPHPRRRLRDRREDEPAGVGHHLHDGARCVRAHPESVGRHPLHRVVRREGARLRWPAAWSRSPTATTWADSIRLPASSAVSSD